LQENLAIATLYVTSERPGAGRTAFCAALATLLARKGRKVAVFKPLRLEEGERPDADLSFYSRLLGEGAVAAGEWPVALPGERLRGGLEEAQAGLTQRVRAAFQELAATGYQVVVEGLPSADAGGRPLLASVGLAQALEAQVVILLRYRPGLKVEEAVSLKALYPSFLGVAINQVTRYRSYHVSAQLIPALESAGVRVLGAIPQERLLQALTIRQVVEHLGGEFLLFEEKADRLIEHFLIGGLVLEWGVNYFGRYDSKGVIVRGDRPDIQMAALGTPMRCLFLTGGHRPTQYVIYEAQEEEIPVVVVPKDTLETVAALEQLAGEGAVHHPDKVERFGQLMQERLNLEALGAAPGL